MSDNVNRVSVLYVISDKRIVGKYKASRILKDFDENGFVIKLVKLRLDFSFELRNGPVH